MPISLGCGFVVVCGRDARQTIGHLPGASLVALGKNGMDDNRRIIEAPGKRPVLKNTPPGRVAYFRRTVTLIDYVDSDNVATIVSAVQTCMAQDPGPAEPYRAMEPTVPLIEGHAKADIIPDPAGYVVIGFDTNPACLWAKVYSPKGEYRARVVGQTPGDVSEALLTHGFISNLDHAMYAGRELGRAETAMQHGFAYVQDEPLSTTTADRTKTAVLV